MCGIAGLIQFSPLHERARTNFQKLPDLLRHRGPDEEGLFIADSVMLFQNRLTLVDKNRYNWPLTTSDDRYRIVFNGEIYNYKELREQLRSDFNFKTQTDTEVLLAAFIKWGAECVQRLDGMFSFFIWDDLKKDGFAARDALGVKPFFYSVSPERSEKFKFIFASESAPLVQSGLVDFKVNSEYILEFLVAPYLTGAQGTPFQDIQILPAGSVLFVKQSQIKIQSFFEYKIGSTRFAGTHFENELDEALSKSVARCFEADFEVGLFLSGGLDSTLIGALSPKCRKAWTLDFENNSDSDYQESLIVKSQDLPFAIRAAQELKHNLNIVSVNDGLFAESLERTLTTNDLICAWEQEVSQQVLSQAAAQSVKAVVVGDAADETHFGYGFLLNPERVVKPQDFIEYFGAIAFNPKLNISSAEHFNEKYIAEAEQKGFRWSNTEERRFAVSQLVFDRWLKRLLHNGDIHSMKYSLEARVPFAQPELLNLSRSLNPNDSLDKKYLRRVASRYLSPELAGRPKSALTKNLKAQSIIHEKLTESLQWGQDLLEPYIDMNQLQQWDLAHRSSTNTVSDRQAGLEFRLLAVLKWWSRFI